MTDAGRTPRWLEESTVVQGEVPRYQEDWQEVTFFIDHEHVVNGERVKSGWKFLPVHYSQDPDMTPEKVEAERALYTRKEDWEMEMEIALEVVSGIRCYPVFTRAMFVRSVLPWDPYRQLTLTCDWNVRLMVWEVIQVYHGRHCVIDEVAMSSPASVPKTAEEFCDRYSEHVGEILIDGDYTGKRRDYVHADASNAFSELLAVLKRRLSCPVRVVARPNPKSAVRIRNLNDAMLGPDGEPRILIAARCGYLIKSLYQDVWKDDLSDAAQEDDESKPNHVLTHATAAVGYYAYRVMPAKTRMRQSAIVTAKKGSKDRLKIRNPRGAL